MKFCVRCGRMLQNNESFCTGCGLKQPFVPPEVLFNTPPPAFNTPAAQFVPAQPVTCTALVPFDPSLQVKVMPFIIWSLILVMIVNPLSLPFAIAAAIIGSFANAETYIEKRSRQRNISAILCIIATAVDFVTIVFLIFALAIKFR